MRACRVGWRNWDRLRGGAVNSGEMLVGDTEEKGGTCFLADYGDAGDARGCHCCCGMVEAGGRSSGSLLWTR